MIIKPPYPHPPIFNSVIELRGQNAFQNANLERAATALAKMYDTHQRGKEFNVQVQLNGDDVHADIVEPKQVHQFFASDLTEQSVMVNNSIRWIQLPPYPGWDSFISRALRDLQKVPKRLGLFPLSRVGIRYQNRIDVPLTKKGVAPFEEYFNVYINLPDLFDPIDGYSWKFDKIFADEKLAVMATSTVLPPEIPDTVAFLLDIDVYANDDMPHSIDGLSQKFEQMRQLKNKVFETCISDKARKMFL